MLLWSWLQCARYSVLAPAFIQISLHVVQIFDGAVIGAVKMDKLDLSRGSQARFAFVDEF